MAGNSGEFGNVDDTTILDEDDLNDVMKEISDIGARFYEFGGALGIRASDLDEINRENLECKMKLRKVVLKCLRQEYKVARFGKPTWKKFVLAVETTGNHALALRIAGNLSASMTSPTTIVSTPTVAPNLLEIIKHAGTSVESLNQECTPSATVLQQLANCCHPVSIIGPHLQLKDHEMEDIEEDNRRAEQKRVAMLKKWHKKFTHKATYLVLVQALANSGRNNQAADVCKIFVESVAAQQGSSQPVSQPRRESQSPYPAETTSDATNPHASTLTTGPIPKDKHLHDQVKISDATNPHTDTLTSGPIPQDKHLHDQGGQYGQYLSASTDNIQTVYKHWKLEEIHKLEITGKGTTIAIIDDGLNRSHFSVRNKCARMEISAYSEQCYQDQAEHGTAVAAIAAGEGYSTKSGDVPPGIAPEANLYIYRLGKKFGANELSAALEHILNLKEPHIDVVAMSICLPGNYEKIETQLKNLAEKKIVCVAAAGNSGSLEPGSKFPANCKASVLSVGALDSKGRGSSLNPESGIDVYAFGEDVLVPSLTAADATSHLDGSSFAVPMVAGFLALLIQCAKTFPNCKGVADAYHKVSFLREHFIKCHKLCKDKRLLHVGSYFKDLWKCKSHNPSPLVEFYREVYP